MYIAIDYLRLYVYLVGGRWLDGWLAGEQVDLGQVDAESLTLQLLAVGNY